MTFNWVPVGDQGACLRKMCWLGLIMLEIVESSVYFESSVLNPRPNTDPIFLAECLVHAWNNETKTYDTKIICRDKVCYVNAHTYMEDWYGLNILSEELLTSNVSMLNLNNKDHS